jgi:hypothetical protein
MVCFSHFADYGEMIYRKLKKSKRRAKAVYSGDRESDVMK